MAGGKVPSTIESTKARELSGDLNPWDRQPEETAKAHAAFVAFRDSMARKVNDLRESHGGSVYRWSSEWSWGYRAFEWDKHMAVADGEALLRFRRDMNDRHRRAARFAQSKIVEWLTNVDVSKLNAGDAAKWFDIAVKVERLANGGDLPIGADGTPAPAERAATLADLLNVAPEVEAELARMIHEGTRVQAGSNGQVVSG